MELVKVEKLKKYFSVSRGFFHAGKVSLKAVDDISFSIEKGRTLGLVGESGCGKTTTGRLILKLLKPDSGQVYFSGQNLMELSHDEMKRLRRRMQIIFQDPYNSLNPRMRVGQVLGEALDIHGLSSGKQERQRRISDLLNMAGLSERQAGKYPHEFSGGQRQRIGIARALAVEPEFIICDEPVSSLDVSVGAQILNLLKDLQKQQGLTYLFIAHNLAVVEYMSHRIAVMYLGKIVESALTAELCGRPLHPYTQLLLSALAGSSATRVNSPEAGSSDGIPLPAKITHVETSRGCCFYDRCPKRKAVCLESSPPLLEVTKEHLVSCFCSSGCLSNTP